MENIEFANSGQPYLFRYRQDNENTLNEIEGNYIYFSTNEKLNDPFDANHKFINISEDLKEINNLYYSIISQYPNNKVKKYLEKIYKNNPNDFRELVLSHMKPFFQKFGIACFSMSQVNMVLWATYANNFQGICIQYNIDLDKDFFEYIRPVEYVEKMEKINYLPENEFEAQKNLFYKKLEIWKYENELRLVKEESGKHKINPNSIRSIAFGLRVKKEFKEKITKIVSQNNNHIKLYTSELLEDSYGLRFTQI